MRRLMALAMAFALVLGVTSSTVAAPAAPLCGGGPGIIAYDGENYTGTSWTLCMSGYYPNLASTNYGNIDNRFSSIRAFGFPSGYYVCFYDKGAFTGYNRMAMNYQGVQYLSSYPGMNNNITSLRREPYPVDFNCWN